MSFISAKSPKTIDPSQKLGGLDPSRVSTSDQARPVPYMAGKNRLGVTFCSKAFNLKTVRSSGDKKGGGGAGTTSYFVSFAAGVCLGPVDNLHEVIFDDVTVWSGSVARGGTDYADITLTINKHACRMRIYWGTDTQVADPHLNDNTLSDPSGQDHPANRGSCSLVFESLPLGATTNVPNIEIIASRYPVPAWSGSAGNIGNDANPIHVLYDLLSNRRAGIGIAASGWDTASLTAAAATLAGNNVGISPVITKTVSARQFIQTICEYVDGYVTASADNKLQFFLKRYSGTPVSIDDSSLLTERQIDPSDPKSVSTRTRVIYSNAARKYKEDSASWRDPMARQITGENSPVSIQRPWVTSQNVALEMAGAAGIYGAIPSVSIALSVPNGVLPFNAIGSRISLAPSVALDVSPTIFRVVEQSIQAPPSQSVDVKCELDLSYLNNGGFVGTIDTWTDDDSLAPGPFDTGGLYELPLGISLPTPGNQPWYLGTKIALCGVVVRGDSATSGYNFLLKKTNAASFSNIGSDNAFAVQARMQQDYGAFDSSGNKRPTIDEFVGFTVDVESLDQLPNDPGLDEAFANKFLIIAGHEIMSLVSATLLFGTTFQIKAIRGRFGTPVHTHFNGERIWIIEKDLINPIARDSFVPGTVQRWKIQPVIEGNEYDASLLGDFPFIPRGKNRMPNHPINVRRLASLNGKAGDTGTGLYQSAGGLATIYIGWDFTEPNPQAFWDRWKAVNPPPYDNTATYNTGDEVSYNGKAWVAVSDTVTGIAPGAFIQGNTTAANINALSWQLRIKDPSSCQLNLMTKDFVTSIDNLDGTTGVITLAGHPFGDGDRIFIDEFWLGEYYIQQGAVYYVQKLTANTFRLRKGSTTGPEPDWASYGVASGVQAVRFHKVFKVLALFPAQKSTSFTYSNVTTWFGTSPVNAFSIRARGIHGNTPSLWYSDLEMVKF